MCVLNAMPQLCVGGPAHLPQGTCLNQGRMLLAAVPSGSLHVHMFELNDQVRPASARMCSAHLGSSPDRALPTLKCNYGVWEHCWLFDCVPLLVGAWPEQLVEIDVRYAATCAGGRG